MAKILLRKIKLLALLLLILTSIMITVSFMPRVRAETKIISITSSGYVETYIQLTANISTVNGTYEIWFDEVFCTSGDATGNYVDTFFTVPPTTAGNHTVKITDVAAGESDTQIFKVLTFYSLEVLPKLEPPTQRQGGDPVQIFLNITGGELIETVANITVQAPTNASYAAFPNATILEDGSGNVTVNYPTGFPLDANTNFTGQYEIFLNATLASKSFFIGLTNSTEYHRFQAVDIKAVYKAEENVTLTVTGKDVYHSVNLTADGAGMINYTDWAIPSNASIGTYTVNITSISPNATIKNPPDIQDFTVPGFDVNITTRNLAKELVPDVAVRVFEDGRSVENGTSGPDGLVRPELGQLKLEIGNYTCKAYFKGEKVGEDWVNITKAESLDFECNLTNLRILVMDKAGIRIPEVEVYLSPEDQTLITNINGTAEVPSLLPNITYVLNASRYNVPFTVNHTIPRLLVDGTPVAWFNESIICPTLTLHINVTNPNANDQPISNAIVKAQELMGGIYYEENTNVDGTVTFHSTFGKYKIEVYDENGIKLNETTLELFENKSISIGCSLYGLEVTIRVIEYFGQPIPNANVTLQREGLLPRSSLTQSDGTASFSNLIGGNLQIAVYLADETQPYVAKGFFIDKSTTIEIKIEKYVMLAGVLVETGQLTTAIIIAVTIILLLSMEVYRRKRLKPQKSSK